MTTPPPPTAAAATTAGSALSAPRPKLLVPRAPVLVLDGHKLVCLTPDGEIKTLTADAARALVRGQMPLVCHGPNIARFLKTERFAAYDALELFAFVHPGRFCVPTPRGIARALHLMEPDSAEDQCLALRDGVRHLLADLAAPRSAITTEKTDPAALAAMMGLMDLARGPGMDLSRTPDEADAGWPWTPSVLAALGRDTTPPTRSDMRAALRVWDKLPEWSVHAPEPPPGHHGVGEAEIHDRLQRLLHRQKREDRPPQKLYAAGLAPAFAPADRPDRPNVVTAEAGTGVGKTLGYLAPATVWAEKNGGAVWVSTYTRNLQRQIDAELDGLYADPTEKSRRAVTRKGRENYLCLLNLEDAAQSQNVMTNEQHATLLGLMTRWAGITEDGDLMGKDFPGWLPGLMGWNRVYGFADRRGECIYSACPHFDKCFVEKSVRKAKRADIVIANHALVMHQLAASGPEDVLPTRYVFDEGHHLFDAADSAFQAHLNGTETADLRRWLLGNETGGNKSRARGIQRRLEDLIAGDDAAKSETEALVEAARALPGPQWRQRLATDAPKGTAEQFLLLCRQQVLARTREQASGYSLETELYPVLPGWRDAARALCKSLNDMRRPMLKLVDILRRRLEDEADTLGAAERERIHFVTASLDRRARFTLGSWIDMLQTAEARAAAPAAVPATAGASETVDWLDITRIDGQDMDAGFYRAAVDPVKLFAERLIPQAQGVVVTSATLRDVTAEDPEGWQDIARRTGMPPDSNFHVASPFDYKDRTRIIVVRDVRKESADETAAAFRALFMAAGGGALGIFTAVQRLRAVHDKMAAPLAESGIRLYAQHVDPLDTGTLIDIFREEENACLLGTDATRDGIDVPGRSLRLVVYDRVPWPRPTILHKARRMHFGRGYDDMLTRFKLKQAYGRLIRRSSDSGVFVMLDSALPTRLCTAFPPGVGIERMGLAEAVAAIRALQALPAETAA